MHVRVPVFLPLLARAPSRLIPELHAFAPAVHVHGSTTFSCETINAYIVTLSGVSLRSGGDPTRISRSLGMEPCPTA